jgi:hypothetical protein
MHPRRAPQNLFFRRWGPSARKNGFLVDFGQIFGPFWIDFGQIFDRFWVLFGLFGGRALRAQIAKNKQQNPQSNQKKT